MSKLIAAIIIGKLHQLNAAPSRTTYKMATHFSSEKMHCAAYTIQ